MREVLREIRYRLLHFGRRGESVGARPLENTQGDRHPLVEIAAAVIVGGPEFDAANVADADHPSVRFRLHDDIAERFGGGEPPLRFDIELEGAGLGHRRLIDDTGGNLHVLTPERDDHVAGGQIAQRKFVRIKPDTHRIVARTEDGDVADPVDTREHVLHMQGGVIGDVEKVARAIGRA